MIEIKARFARHGILVFSKEGDLQMNVVRYFRRLATNAELMEEMFAKTGVDDWFAENSHGPEVLRRAATRCATCNHVGECAKWLGEHETAIHSPDFCNNHDLIERIHHEQILV